MFPCSVCQELEEGSRVRLLEMLTLEIRNYIMPDILDGTEYHLMVERKGEGRTSLALSSALSLEPSPETLNIS